MLLSEKRGEVRGDEATLGADRIQGPEGVLLPTVGQRQVQTQIPCGDDRQKGKSNSKGKSKKKQRQRQRQEQQLAGWLRFYFPTLAMMKPSRTWGTRAVVVRRAKNGRKQVLRSRSG